MDHFRQSNLRKTRQDPCTFSLSQCTRWLRGVRIPWGRSRLISSVERSRRRERVVGPPLCACFPSLDRCSEELYSGVICYPTLDRRKVEFSGLWSRRRAGCADGSHEGNRGLVADGPVRSILVIGPGFMRLGAGD
jgi:hypothetical protein